MKLSVIIPVYNKAPFLRRCLDSVVRQTRKDAEIILIDDGSTDNSGEICEEYANQPNFRIYHTGNRGVSEARNTGMELAKGEFLTFLDADDEYEPNAVDFMISYTNKGYDVVQFGQIRHQPGNPVPIPRCWPEGEYSLWQLSRYWPMVWNKIYRAEFIKKNGLRFRAKMQFGEDEIFNVEALMRTGRIYHGGATLIHHHTDDTNSLCRGNLTLNKLEDMDALEGQIAERERANGNAEGARWIERVMLRHHHTQLFAALGWTRGLTGKYDVVYFVKDCPQNEELRYSLRSVEQNFPHRNVWIYGAKPNGIRPDFFVESKPYGVSKWQHVRMMIEQVCLNDELTEDVWLFNDDFFIMEPYPETATASYNGDLGEYIQRRQQRLGYMDEWAQRLHAAWEKLLTSGKTQHNYEVHKPMLINRKKALQVLQEYQHVPAFRSIYGNVCAVGGTNESDRKVQRLDFPTDRLWNWPTISTDDGSFENGDVGGYIRNKFTEKSRFED